MASFEALIQGPTGIALRDSSGQPKYEQLRDFVAQQIEQGQLPAGEALPPEARISETLGIARSTVRQALSTLEREGLIRRIHGKGTFIHEQARQRLQKGQDLFALIIPETSAGFYPSLQMSFEEAAAGFHNQVIICNSNNEIDKQGNSILQLMDLNVAGVAIVPTTNPPTPAFHVRQLRERGIPVVCCSRPIEGVQAPLLSIPFEEVGSEAGKLIREAGHQHVLFLTGTKSDAGTAYEIGFRQALGPRVQVETYYGTNPNPDVTIQEAELAAELERQFAQPAPPTAIFASFDSLAELAFVLLSRLGLRVPEDVSLVGFGGSRRQGALTSRLTSITVDEAKMGHEAIELLEQMRAGALPLTCHEVRMMPLGVSEGRTLSHPKKKSELLT
ncbi:LacI family transcriptional regulator [Blastopirellula sp. J2-11]|uniref:GntR family transcriptional regulator n=1 Tax=Blastopirellula sp. J2-11 TaxID=2943192 RepID=UPI0021C6A79C|nr:LacI family DNA-binding transcriptional regulator [Blastopirellula sp. J2-11]UUO04929.1 LacI family transcriptional regulator [Blastopirellula sp. J2-11]